VGRPKCSFPNLNRAPGKRFGVRAIAAAVDIANAKKLIHQVKD
jgi:hypothetical protein